MPHWRGGLNLAVRMRWPTSYLGTTYHVTHTPGSTVRPRVHDAVGTGLTPIVSLRVARWSSAGAPVPGVTYPHAEIAI